MNAGVIPWNIWNSACTVDIPLMALVAGSIIECVNSPGNSPKTTTSVARIAGEIHINNDASCAFLGNKSE